MEHVENNNALASTPAQVLEVRNHVAPNAELKCCRGGPPGTFISGSLIFGIWSEMSTVNIHMQGVEGFGAGPTMTVDAEARGPHQTTQRVSVKTTTQLSNSRDTLWEPKQEASCTRHD